MNVLKTTLFPVAALLLAACTATGVNSGTVEERREAILNMRQEVLTELFSLRPDLRSQVSEAAGYAVFTNANINVILASFGGGVGITRNNATREDTYMRMGEIGIGIGAGVQDFRAVFIFHSEPALERFLDVGLSFGGSADAAARAGDLGAAVSGNAIADNVSVYQLTQSGLALQATVRGTRYWRHGELNGATDPNER